MEPLYTDNKNIWYPPGGILIWMLIILELVTFGAGLIVFGIYAHNEPQEFHRSAMTLNKAAGTFNTMILLTSGFFMKKTLVNFHLKKTTATIRNLHFTMFTGAIFILIKAMEYSGKITDGIHFDTNHFYNFYWLITGFHLIHVLAGMLILGYFRINCKKNSINIKPEDMEAGAAFWHMCDLIWLLIFPPIYLLC